MPHKAFSLQGHEDMKEVKEETSRYFQVHNLIKKHFFPLTIKNLISQKPELEPE